MPRVQGHHSGGPWSLHTPDNGGAGGNWFLDAIWVDNKNVDPAPDGTMNNPFPTLTMAIAAAVAKQDALPIGKLPTERAGTRQVFIVAGGIYDEDMLMDRGDTFYVFLSMGPVTLGNGLADNFGSTNTRDVRWRNTQAQEDADSGLVSDNRRPQLLFGDLMDFGEASSTHTAAAVAWDISGSLILQTPGGAGESTTAELHLGRVKVRGTVDGTDDFGIRNCYIYQCYFDTTFNFDNANLQVVESTEFDGPTTVASYGRLSDCEIDGGFTVGSFAPALPPGGFFHTDFSGTFTSPGNMVMDCVTNGFFVANGAVLAGGAAKVILDDCDGGGGGAGPIPSDYLQLAAPVVTAVTGPLIDIPGMAITVTLTSTAHIHGVMTFSTETAPPGGGAINGAFAVQINGVDGQEVERFLSGSTDDGIGAAQYRTAAPLPPGVYTIKGRWRRVSGARGLQLNTAQLFGWGLEGGGGGALEVTAVQAVGPYVASAGERVRYTTGVGTIRMPAGPSTNDRVAIKNVSPSVVAITVDGNGNSVEALGTYALAPIQPVAGDGIAVTYQYDGTNWIIT